MNVSQMIRTPLAIGALALVLAVPARALAEGETVQWLNHLGFQGAATDATAAFDAAAGGLKITAAAAGDYLVAQGAQVPPGYLVSGVRLCYQLSSADSFISQVSITQLQDPPVSSLPVLDDPADLTDLGPVCVNSALVTPFDPALGALTLELGTTFADAADTIVVKGVALLTVADPAAPANLALAQLQADQEALAEDVGQLQADMVVLQDDVSGFENHTHTYLTGRGKGHNNTVATTGAATAVDGEPATLPATKKNAKQ
jgi:hypothetical protein